jgi:ubiquinone/menaquinone biosynthesis C-methylase UbiE
MSRRFFGDIQYFHGNRAKLIYEFLGRRYARTDHWRFMNYGYAFAEESDSLVLDAADHAERYNAQLYHVVASQVPVAGRDVLDVGSGRGGGASYIQRYLKPSSTTGMDLADSAVQFCQRAYHVVSGLSFVQGDAMRMPFEDESFDVVINVESAHCYPDKAAFLTEVARVLRPGGVFLFTDFTVPGKPSGLDWGAAGFAGISTTDVTEGIVRALTIDDARREQEIVDHVPFGLRWLGNLWSGRPGSWIYRDFVEGRRSYIVCSLAKEADAVAPAAEIRKAVGA